MRHIEEEVDDVPTESPPAIESDEKDVDDVYERLYNTYSDGHDALVNGSIADTREYYARVTGPLHELMHAKRLSHSDVYTKLHERLGKEQLDVHTKLLEDLSEPDAQFSNETIAANVTRLYNDFLTALQNGAHDHDPAGELVHIKTRAAYEYGPDHLDAIESVDEKLQQLVRTLEYAVTARASSSS